MIIIIIIIIIMAALSSEKVDVHIMKEPPSGEWTFLTTETTDRNGRVQCSLAQKDAMGYGVYPVFSYIFPIQKLYVVDSFDQHNIALQKVWSGTFETSDFQVKMVVRGDHTSLDLHIAVLPPKV